MTSACSLEFVFDISRSPKILSYNELCQKEARNLRYKDINQLLR